MTIHINQLIELLAVLSENKNLMATGAEVLKGGAITACTTVLGGLLLGPIGLAVGGVLGGFTSALTCNDFKSVASILRALSTTEKIKLTAHFMNAFRDFGVDDVAALVALLVSSTSFQERAIAHLSTYLTNEMKMRVK